MHSDVANQRQKRKEFKCGVFDFLSPVAVFKLIEVWNIRFDQTRPNLSSDLNKPIKRPESHFI